MHDLAFHVCDRDDGQTDEILLFRHDVKEALQACRLACYA